jgi:site-specific DNA recombinase
MIRRKVENYLRMTRKTVTKSRRDKQNDDFPLRGLISCDTCEVPLTAGWSHGNGGKYAYYFCRCGCGVTLRRDKMETQFFEYLQSIKPSAKVLNLFYEIMRAAWNERKKNITGQKHTIGNKLHAAEQKKARLDD